MSDLIDRQAAIDAVNKHGVLFEFYLPHEFYEVKKEIRELPSAQPEPHGVCTDLIDRQTAIVTAVKAAIDWHKLANPQYSIAYCIGEAMRELPSADAVEVVRCKDCKYQDKGENESESWNVCKYRPWLCFGIDDDDYCSNGERRDE